MDILYSYLFLYYFCDEKNYAINLFLKLYETFSTWNAYELRDWSTKKNCQWYLSGVLYLLPSKSSSSYHAWRCLLDSLFKKYCIYSI